MRPVKKQVIEAALMMIALTILAVGAVALLIYCGIIFPNASEAGKYQVRGVDVSHYQGDIDWELLSEQNIEFAYIKATEGSSYIDEMFAYNYSQATKTGLRVGAYHFFSFESSGKTQAENFIEVVPKDENALPPVIDFEPYGEYLKRPTEVETVRIELGWIISDIKDYYGKRPVIYTTEKAYKWYIAGYFDEYDIWIRNVLCRPTLSDDRSWTFWQYSNRGKLDGYSGEEKFIDLNVFSGSQEEFSTYGNDFR